jgi:hypothetical protein
MPGIESIASGTPSAALLSAPTTFEAENAEEEKKIEQASFEEKKE